MTYQALHVADRKSKRAKSTTKTSGVAISIAAFLGRLAPPLVAAVVSSLAAFGALRLWHLHVGVPMQYDADALASGMNVKQMVVNGSYFTDGRLGAPFGQHFQDWPLPDFVSLAIVRFFSLFSSNWAAVDNAMFLLSFPLAAMAAWWAFKKLGVSTWVAVALGVLFSILPFHHIRGESHLFLSNYFVIPFGLYLAVSVLDGTPLFSSVKNREGIFKYASLRTLQTVALAALIGLDGVYYTAFTMLAIGTAVVLRLIVTKQWRSVLPGITVLAVVFGAIVVSLSPALLYHLDHGSNPVAAQRQASDTEYYGLKLSQMLVPSPGHRIDSFNALQDRYYNTFPIPSERGSSALGFIGATGLLFLLGYGIVRMVRGGAQTVAATRYGQLASITIVTFVVATIGGISTMISLLILPEIRSWNRMSLFIAAAALCAVGLLIDSGLRRITKHTLRIAITALAVLGLIGVGFLDQTNDSWVPQYASTSKEYLGDQAFFRSIEDKMPTGAKIFELPQMTFPEGAPINDLHSYDLVKPYLHTSDLEWSFAGVKGRLESVWQDRLPKVDATNAHLFLQDVVAAGFTGIYIDSHGFKDKGVQIQKDLEAQLNIKPVVDETGYKVFYDIRPFAEQLQQTEASVLNSERSEMLSPVYLEEAKKPYATETEGNNHWQWAKGNSTEFPVYNASGSTHNVRLTFGVKGATNTPSQVNITWPDGSTQTVNITSQPVIVSKDLTVPDVRSQLKMTSNAPRIPSDVDPRDLRFQVSNLEVDNLETVPAS